MPSFPANISAPSPRFAPRSTQDVIISSNLHNAPEIGGGTGQNGPVGHPKRHRKVCCDSAAEQKN